ncbi:MAG: metallophosphoesterase [Clostridia bacterium]|nr:metallophosphoesterase [Clostridia bacterium]
MIYVTGDTHGTYDFDKLVRFAAHTPQLTKADFVIIAGDFGGVWYDKTLDRDLTPYEELPFTVLFVDGNHENFDLLNSFPVEMWQGGKIHRVRPHVIHLMRGQIFELEGNRIFTFGGGTSIDRYMRRERISWWPQEIPSYEEFDEAVANLKAHGHRVDYVITHSCDEKALYSPLLGTVSKSMTVYPENQMLMEFERTIQYRHWYFGHYHVDGYVTDRKTALYHDILPLGV